MSITHNCDWHVLDRCILCCHVQAMTVRMPARTPPRFYEGLPERLAALGLTEDAARALMDLDTAMFLWHRMSSKGEMPGRIIDELGIDLELTHFSSLTAISRIEAGTDGHPPRPATIGLLAEEMNIDPSRASRIATDLIGRGYLRREAVQDDGRKTVLVLTDQAIAVFACFCERKWDKMLDLFRDWSEDDITRFSVLFQRYTDSLRDNYSV
jgi:DNA-binding MarR family transcriptional regulator